MKTISILNPISNHYRKFIENQTLTDVQLNEFIDYFNDQDHLSRIEMNGVGILTGFEVLYTNIWNAPKIIINQGCAITTDGDLLFFLNNVLKVKGADNIPFKVNTYKEYTHFAVYDNREIYARFYTDKDRKNQIKLWELTTAKGNKHAVSLRDFEGDMEDMVVLLYIENYEKQGDGCSVKNCDNQGLEQVSNLKVLLISETDINYILKNDTLFKKHSWQEFRQSLSDVKLKRVLLNNINTAGQDHFSREFLDIIQFNDSINNLIAGYDAIFDKFGKTLISEDIKELFDFNKLPIDFQYRYDLLRDLIDTYDEIKDGLLDLNLESCPNINAFQKHLLLGKVIESENYKTYRHDFYRTPINGHEDDSYKKVLSLIARAENIVKKYDTSHKTSIRITPSSIKKALGERAIPFYYNLDDSFLKSWNYEKTKNLKSKYNLSYHIEKLSHDDFIQNPLAYTIDKNDFLRIEGHQGKHYKDVVEELLELKRKNSLSFDIKALSLNLTEKDINLDDYECDFEDLSILLKAWRTEQNSILAEMSRFFSAFSTTDPGGNVVAVKSDLEVNLKMQEMFAMRNESKAKKSPNPSPNMTVKSNNPNSGFNNTVEDNLTLDEGTLGPFIKNAIDLNPGGSANDIMATYQVDIDKNLDVEIWNEDVVELKEFIITDVVDTLVHSLFLEYYIPTDIRDIDYVILNGYQLTIEKVCQRVKNLQAQYQRKNVKDGSKQILGLMINQLSIVCSSGKKLEILLQEIEKRKKDILAGIQLANFVESHPGLQHHAGVPVGGTFVVVYAGKKVVQQELEVIEAVKESVREVKQADVFREARHIGAPIGIKVDEKYDYSKYKDDFYRRIYPNHNEIKPVKPIIDNTVIADFYLPYTCCSDCSTTNFVLAKPPVKLRIEKDLFCIGEDTSPLELQVTPNDGVIKMIPEVSGISIDGNHLVIDGNTISEDDYGKQLKFTVNDQFTDAELRIFKNPDFDFTFEIATKTREVTGKEVKIYGTVSDKTDPIPGVTISVHGTKKGTTTDFDGKYTITTNIGEQLDFYFEGMKTESRIVESEGEINVTLEEAPKGEKVREIGESVSVNFTVKGSYLPKGTEFLWDFGDGTLESNRFEENPRHVYSLPVNKENKVNVKLLVTNATCQKTVTHEVILEEKLPEAMNCKEPTLAEFKEYMVKLEALPKVPTNLTGFEKDILVPLKGIITSFINAPEDFIEDYKSNLKPDENQYLTIIQAIVDKGDLKALNHVVFKTGTRILLIVLYRILSCCDLKDKKYDGLIIEGYTNPTHNIITDLQEKDVNIDENKLSIFFESLIEQENFTNYINGKIEKIIGLLSENEA